MDALQVETHSGVANELRDGVALYQKGDVDPYTLHPTPYTLHPTPYTLHPKP